MTAIVADRVLETSTTTGTGPYTLNGAVTGFVGVSSVSTALDTFNYFAEDVAANGSAAGGWEVGIGTVNANGTIDRAVQTSSNNNLPVSWAAGTRRFGLTLSAAQFVALQTPSVTFPAGAALGGNRALRLAAGKAAYADSGAPGHANLVLGISRNAAALNSPVAIQTGGLMTEPSWTWTPDQPVFCGSEGVLTQASPASGFALIVGVAVSATQILIEAKMPILLT